MGAPTQHNTGKAGGSGKGRLPEPRHLVVGRVTRPHGVRGELRAEIMTGYPELLSQHRFFFLSAPNSPDVGRQYPVERVRLHAGMALLKLGGCDDRNAAEGRARVFDREDGNNPQDPTRCQAKAGGWRAGPGGPYP